MSSFLLKLIAILAMTIDHTATVVGQLPLMEAGMSAIASGRLLTAMNTFGRMAFPLFAFMIAEGCRKTRSMPRYLGRLALFAVLSEPIFYFTLNLYPDKTWGTFFDNLLRKNFTNVFFTLFLGAAAIYGVQLLEKAAAERNLAPKFRLLALPVVLLFVLMGGYFSTDYGMAGVLLIAALYFLPTKPLSALTVVLWSMGLYVVGYGRITGTSIFYFLGASLAILPILLYNGRRGPRLKWIFYIYYPAHLLILLLLNNQLL